MDAVERIEEIKRNRKIVTVALWDVDWLVAMLEQAVDGSCEVLDDCKETSPCSECRLRRLAARVEEVTTDAE